MLEESGWSGKIYCANCRHCKLIKITADDGQKLEKVRCEAGQWKKKLGEEKLYRYSTLAKRTKDSCSDYDEMGEPKAFIKELKKRLLGLLGKDDLAEEEL